MIATTEYRHGTITLSFLTAPVREKVIAVKAAATAIASALLVFLAVLLSVGIAQIWVGGRADYHFGNDEWELIGRLFLCAVLAAIIGLFLGASLKRQLGAIILVLGWLFFVELPPWASSPDTMDYLIRPADRWHPRRRRRRSLVRALGGRARGYAAGLGAVAVAVTRRRDIT